MAMLRVSFGPSADARDSAPLALRCARPSHRPKNLAEISRYLTTLIGAGAASLAHAISTVINLSANSSEEPHPRLRFGNINGCAAHKPKPLPFAIGYRAPWNRQSRMEESEQRK